MSDAPRDGSSAAPADAPRGDDEHAAVGAALDGIEAALDEVAATIARMT